MQKVLKASGLYYKMHSAGTTVGKLRAFTGKIPPPHCSLGKEVRESGADLRATEGSWDEVMKVIGQAHSIVHQNGAVRVQSSMRVGSRLVKSRLDGQQV